MTVQLLGLLPESVLHSGWFAVLAAFVAINTVMYVVLALAMLIRGFVDAIMMRSQQAMAVGGPGFLPPEH